MPVTVPPTHLRLVLSIHDQNNIARSVLDDLLANVDGLEDEVAKSKQVRLLPPLRKWKKPQLHAL